MDVTGEVKYLIAEVAYQMIIPVGYYDENTGETRYAPQARRSEP